MDIVVLVKGVPDSEARVSPTADGTALEVEEKYELNYFDELAVEEALRLREAASGGKVLALSYGGGASLEALKKAVSMGADEAVHVLGPERGDPDGLVTATVLAACLGSLSYDLVLCGRRASDDDAGVVGPMVAELLGIPHIGPVVEVAPPQGDRILAVRDAGRGAKERVSSPLPVLLTTQKGLNEPRVPTIQGVMKGMKLQPRTVTPEGLGLGEEVLSGRWRITAFLAPPRRPPVRFIGGEDPAAKAKELARILREEIRILS